MKASNDMRQDYGGSERLGSDRRRPHMDITAVITTPKNVHWRAIGLFVVVAMGVAVLLGGG